MPQKHTITGIILKRQNYSEADKIVTVLSREYGKQVLIAKGVRKINSKRKGHIELFSHVRLSYVEQERWGILTEAETIEQFGSRIESWEHLGHAFHVGEIIDRLLPEDEAHERIYMIFLRFLQALAQEHEVQTRERIVRLCEQTILDELGYWNSKEFGSYRVVHDHSHAKERNKSYIQNIIERDLKSIRIFEQPALRKLYVEE